MSELKSRNLVNDPFLFRSIGEGLQIAVKHLVVRTAYEQDTHKRKEFGVSPQQGHDLFADAVNAIRGGLKIVLRARELRFYLLRALRFPRNYLFRFQPTLSRRLPTTKR